MMPVDGLVSGACTESSVADEARAGGGLTPN
jgi:hypothetical protein